MKPDTTPISSLINTVRQHREFEQLTMPGPSPISLPTGEYERNWKDDVLEEMMKRETTLEPQACLNTDRPVLRFFVKTVISYINCFSKTIRP